MVQDDDAVIGFTPDEFESGINLIFYLSITIIPLNMSGSLYVLYRVASAYWNSRPRAIPASLRLPMYIVFIDLMCSFTFAAEMVHLYVMRRSPEPPFAYILGGCVTFVIVSNFVLVTQAAFNSWNRVVRKQPVDTGPFEWKLLAPTIFVPAVVVTVFASIGALGANNYFCWIRKQAFGTALFLAIVVMLSMFALWYFYVAIMIEIFKVSRGSFLNTVITYQPSKSPIAAAAQAAAERLGAPEPEFGSNNQRSGSSTLTTIERQAMVKICMYMLACFVQYLPGIPYAVSFVAPSQPYILYCLAIISINCGGLVNATALILNEGLSVRQQQPSTQQSSSNWIYPAQSPRIPNKRNSFSVSRSQFSVNFAPTASGSHFRPPSFQGMQLSVMPQSGSHISQGSVDPYSTGNNHYPGPSFDSHQKVPSDVGAPSNMASSFDAMWDRLGPQAATTRSPNVAAPIPLRISQDTGVRRSADHNHGSEYPPMVDHVGMRDISHAYANIAQQQQRNAGRNSGSFH